MIGYVEAMVFIPRIAAVATFGLVGFLGGPPLVGLIAEVLGLDTGLAIIGGLLLIGYVEAMVFIPRIAVLP
ncbi:MAG: hypothetical protein AAFU60_10465 [Bacteroidota bacterium]